MAAPEERVSPCPAPDIRQGFDQCAHGTWPCADTETAWQQQGRTRDQEMLRITNELAQEAALDDEHQATLHAIKAAAREGRTIDWDASYDTWEAALFPMIPPPQIDAEAAAGVHQLTHPGQGIWRETELEAGG